MPSCFALHRHVQPMVLRTPPAGCMAHCQLAGIVRGLPCDFETLKPFSGVPKPLSRGCVTVTACIALSCNVRSWTLSHAQMSFSRSFLKGVIQLYRGFDRGALHGLLRGIQGV